MLLSDPIKLRSSTVIESYRDARWIPHRYGDLSSSPQSLVQLSDTLFVWGEGNGRVSGVQIDGQNTVGYKSYTGPDKTGRTVCFVELAAPLPTGAEITATGYGVLSERNGRLIENPADVLRDVFRWNDYEINDRIESGLNQLRSQCAAEDLRIAGTVGSGGTLRAAINEIVRSIGGGWASGNFWLHPQPEVLQAVPANTIARLRDAKVERCEADRRNAFAQLRIEFDDQSYQAKHRQAVVVRARPSYDDRASEQVLLAPWLRTQAAALAVAKRYLRRATGQVFEVQIDAEIPAQPLREGDVFAMESARFPVAGLQWLTVLAAYRREARLQLMCELIVPQAVQAFDIVSRTVAGGITQLPAVEVEIRDGNVRFTVFGDDGKPLPKVRVSLNGAAAKLSDANGLVIFPKPAVPGLYTLYVYRTGSVPVELPVNIP